ncbi:glutamate-1-semialdehyde 2,1-aminomutase [Candidatus Aerophobetes bacterium]|nr:glutamate-1-semialdehyde 2,1-aminomutase [Candidatus Aerophobetes bacterium]
MEEIYRIYEGKTKKSAASYKEARKYVPLGVSSPIRFWKPYPIYVDRTEGTKIIDVDGNEYIDFGMCYGAQMIGYAHPKLVPALKKQVERGTLYTIPHNLSTELAKEIIKRFPVDQVRFTNSGTETTMHMLRLARGYTGRDKIIKIGGCYHGVHDYIITKDDPKETTKEAIPSSRGIPVSTLQNTLMGVYNDLTSIELLFDQYKGQIAGIIIEPVMMNRGIILPEDNFLKGVEEICHREGALLIFDEVKTGVKIAWGGASEYYNMEPHIIGLAKSIGGGLPLGAFGARKEIMSVLESKEVFHAGTYNANPLCMAAGLVTLRDILTRESYKEAFRLNEKLTNGCNEIIAKYELPLHTVSIGACGTIQFCKEPLTNHKGHAKFVDVEMGERFWISMLSNGVIPCPYPPPREHWTISVQHTDEDVDKYLETFEKIAPKLKKS